MFLKNFFTLFEGFFYLFLRKVAICTQISACFPQDVHTSIPTGSKKNARSQEKALLTAGMLLQRTSLT